MRHLKPQGPRVATLFLVLLGLAVALHGCEAPVDVDEFHAAVTTNDKRVIVSGDGTGSGTVSVPPTGGRKALTCVITAGQTDLATCSKYYPHGTTITLTATPATGHTFTRWSGACLGTEPTCTLSMTLVRRVTATFAPPASEASLTITGGGSGSGSVTIAAPPGGGTCTSMSGQTSGGGCLTFYELGTEVTLAAAAADQNTFAGWSGDCRAAGSSPTCQLTMTENRQVVAVFDSSGAQAPEATLGKWGVPFSTPVIAIHMALMPDRKVLLFGHTGQPWLWDPSTYPANPGSGFSNVSTATEVFCSGHTFLPDGRLLVPGGHDEVLGNGHGIPDVNIFGNSSWESAPPMREGRWYPTATTLANGEVVVTAGTDNSNINVRLPEVWNGVSWRQLTKAAAGLPYYPRMFLAPNGRVFYAGPSAKSMYLNTSGDGAWTTVGNRLVADRNYGSAVMLDAKVLTMGGGGADAACTQPVSATAEIIDLNASSPSWRAVGSMTYPRRQLNATILPDGTVLATGGTSACGFSNESGSVYAAELWNPSTEQWTTLASMRMKRVYHSSAILLPDGRILSAGGGDNAGSSNQFNAEIFTPPYLFNSDGTPATRPTYTLSSTSFGYGQSFRIDSPDAANIRKVTLVRPSAVTHTFNQSQQLNTLSFAAAADGQSLTATTPANGNLAPPGPYLLFLVSSTGVPSAAETVFLR
jgi:hypothetical protein